MRDTRAPADLQQDLIRPLRVRSPRGLRLTRGCSGQECQCRPLQFRAPSRIANHRDLATPGLAMHSRAPTIGVNPDDRGLNTSWRLWPDHIALSLSVPLWGGAVFWHLSVCAAERLQVNQSANTTPDAHRVRVKFECGQSHALHELCVPLPRAVPPTLRCEPGQGSGYGPGDGGGCILPGDFTARILRELRDNLQESIRRGYVLVTI